MKKKNESTPPPTPGLFDYIDSFLTLCNELKKLSAVAGRIYT